MSIMKYKILNPVIGKDGITGYNLIDSSGKITKIRTQDLIGLIGRCLVSGEIVELDGEKHIVYLDSFKFSDIPENTSYTVVSRILQEDTLIAYDCRSDTGEIKRLKPIRVWELAMKGKISNLTAHVINDRPVLKGKAESMFILDSVKI